MTSAIEPILASALVLGFFGSVHCLGMCGGIAGSLGALSGQGNRSMAMPALEFNVGRIISYAILGAIAGGILGAAGEIMALKSLGKYLRAITALMVLFIGLQ